MLDKVFFVRGLLGSKRPYRSISLEEFMLRTGMSIDKVEDRSKMLWDRNVLLELNGSPPEYFSSAIKDKEGKPYFIGIDWEYVKER